MNSYPFLSKSQIKSRIAAEPEFATTCLLVLDSRQTSDEHDEKTTKYKNRRGFMSSHAVNGTKLADKARSGETLTDEDMGRVQAMVVSYSKQLAAHFRAEAISENPELARVAEIFSAG